MSEPIDVRVPELGDFADIPVIEVLVHPGDTVAVESPLITLESDKATMEIPSSHAGVVQELRVAVGDHVSTGTVILVLEGAAADGGQPAQPIGTRVPEGGAPSDPSPEAPPAAAATAQSTPPPPADRHSPLVVIGAGPGGYTAAFRAADLGIETLLVERDATLGGVCLNVGCIPSKALLHIAAVLTDAEAASAHGIGFGSLELDLDAIRASKDAVVARLTSGLDGLAAARKVGVVRGDARFTSPRTIEVTGADGATSISFDHAIIAVGSRPVVLPGFPEDPRIMDSTGALELNEIPERLLIVGGGIIGLEMACVYDALGSRVTVVEMADQLIPGCDPDLVAPLADRISGRYAAIHLNTKVFTVEAKSRGLRVSFDGENAPKPMTVDRVLVAVGRSPNGALIDAAAAGVVVDERGFIAVDGHLRTNVPHIFAIGDVVGHPMLAHKATHEAKVAAEVIAGEAGALFDPAAIPSVAYTDPEVAWAGLTETDADAKKIAHEVHRFPWAASGRALGVGRPEGVTKLMVEPGTGRILGAGIVGKGAGELIAELVLAMEFGATVDDVAMTIHPHPTLSETIGLAAEVASGVVTDLPPRRGVGTRATRASGDSA